MSDGESRIKTPKEREAELLMRRVEACEAEIQAVLAKYRMRLSVIEIRQDAKTVGLEIKAVMAEKEPIPFGENGGN